MCRIRCIRDIRAKTLDNKVSLNVLALESSGKKDITAMCNLDI